MNILNTKINKEHLVTVLFYLLLFLLSAALAVTSRNYDNDLWARLIAGMSVVTRVMMLVSSAVIGFGQGYQPVCSFNYGANLKKRVREGFFFCVKYGTIFLCTVGALCFAFAPYIISWFRDDPDVIAVGTVALRFQSAVLPLIAVIVITNMMLQSMGKGFKASLTASARNGIFFLPMILILPRLFGLLGVEMTQACADILSLALSIPLAVSELKKMKE